MHRGGEKKSLNPGEKKRPRVQWSGGKKRGRGKGEKTGKRGPKTVLR